MTSQTHPTITISHSLEMEARRILFLACKLPRQIYQNRGFYILPNLPRGNAENIVVFPDLDYSSIPQFWEKTSKLKPWTPIEAPAHLVEQTITLIKPTCNTSKLNHAQTQLQSRLNSHSRQFWNTLFHTFPQYKNRLDTVNISLTQFGPVSTFRLATKDNDLIDIFLRADHSINKVFEAILTCILRPKLEKLNFSWQEIESVVDFLLIESSLGINKDPLRGTIPSLRKTQNSVWQKQSLEFQAKLGFVTHANWERKNGAFYFSGKKIQNLSQKEHLLLEVLLTKRPQTTTFDEIMDNIWPNNQEITQWAITKQVQRLREKLKQNGINIPIIQAGRGVGYSIV